MHEFRSINPETVCGIVGNLLTSSILVVAPHSIFRDERGRETGNLRIFVRSSIGWRRSAILPLEDADVPELLLLLLALLLFHL